MAITELESLVSPPANPVNAGSLEHIFEIEKTLGCSIPIDYAEFGIRYGSGRFCNGFVRVFNPFSPSYKKWLDSRIEALNAEETWGHLDSYSVFPKEHGLLPWGDDENGNILCWLTDGNPNRWPVVILQHGGGLEQFDMPMSTFLTRAFQNQIDVGIWHEPFVPEEVNFDS